MRDPWRLKVMVMADQLAVDVYRATKDFPVEERFGLQSQLRRAATSVPANLVEGSARRTLADYTRFINIALSSASEARYLVSLAQRLGYIDGTGLVRDYGELIRALQGLVDSLAARPEA